MPTIGSDVESKGRRRMKKIVKFLVWETQRDGGIILGAGEDEQRIRFEAEMKSSCLTDAGFLLEMIKIFWNYMVVVVCVCEYTKNHWVSILNG